MLYYYIKFMFMDVSVCVFFFKQKTAYEMRISDWSSDVCSSDLAGHGAGWNEYHRQMAKAQRSDHQPRHDLVANAEAGDTVVHRMEIGRASCRERGCQYV